ncbi:MAG: hypothetical protein JJU06_00515 [Ectothiorhodospiraceae bacterium]|nr:hypothetical protein [Ectothiorhodospiraceae bacterium]
MSDLAMRHVRSSAGTGLVLVLVAACLAALWLGLEHRSTWRAAWQPAPPVDVALAGEHYRIPAARAETLALLSRLRFADGEAEARALVEEHLRQGLDTLFADLSAELPRFADWYYSLGGEYSRISMSLLRRMRLTEGDFVERKAQELVFDGAGFRERLDALRLQTDERMLVQMQAVRDGWLAEVLQVLEADRLALPPPPSDQSLALDELMARLSGHGSDAYTLRLSASSAVAGGAAAGPLLWRLASRRALVMSGQGIAARGAARGAARAGAAAGGGAAICAPTGPGALACALAAGGATWLATDWALLRVDEALNREEFLLALQAGLDELRCELESDLLAAYDGVLEQRYGAMQQDIRRTFVPVGVLSPEASQ